MCKAVDEENRLLDNRELYRFREDWTKILYVMPELIVTNGAWDWKSGLEQAENELVKAKTYLAGE